MATSGAWNKTTASIAGKKGNIAKKEHLDKLLDYVASGGARDYHTKLRGLSQKKKLTLEEYEFMDRSEKLFEFKRARLQRRELVGEGGGPVQMQIDSEQKKKIAKRLLENQ